ncbi:hypothetical protein ScPMuIL_015746 [Solemya velum]
MADDIVARAAKRRQQRPTATRQEATLFTDKEGVVVFEIAPSKQTTVTEQTKGRTRLRHARRQRDFETSQSEDLFSELSDTGSGTTLTTCIRCKIQDRDTVAVVNPSSPGSLMSRDLAHGLGSKPTSTKSQNSKHDQKVTSSLVLQETELTVDCTIKDNVPDIVLGMDFLTHHMGVIDFGEKILTLKTPEKLVISLLTEADIPLKYRRDTDLTASI